MASTSESPRDRTDRKGDGPVALLVDYDNVSVGLSGTGVRGVTPGSLAQALRSAAEQFGPLVIARVYAPDVRRTPNIREVLAKHGFVVVTGEQRSHTRDTDVVMALEAQELLFTRSEIATYILVSGDSDFVPLARSIVSKGKQLVIICPKAVASLLTVLAHQFIALDNLVSATPTPTTFKPLPRPRSTSAAGPVSPRKSRPKLRVFLCHSKHDKPAVRRLYERLQEEEGIQPWLDEKDLLPGQDWRLQITKEVRSTHCVLVCLSTRAMNVAGFVHQEIGFALDAAESQPEGTIFLIPVKFEECTVPERLSRFHWVNLFDEDGHSKLIRSLRTRADAL